MLLDRLDLVGRTSELARCFGIDFFSVLSRGSQYRVESMTLRLAHSQNYLALSPSAEQVARQPAMEALPLILEPRSAMYPDPVCVLDFQSLYPSMIIAYNLCYSTCVGRVAHSTADEPIKLGCSKYAAPTDILAGGRPGARGLAIAPNGVAFVPADVRPGVLPRLLREILETRIMVKGAMKRAPLTARVLLRCLNARQFGLKLIANVTYGYTAAGFSGRMPMAELADAIVQSARETLEAAIRLVESVQRWRAKVVYGDTDSLFVQLPGRTVAEAFEIGAEIAAAVTAANPPPVVLKLEKVYHPCVLLSKKRYAGAMYESPSQIAPTFDAKGIETVRRDSCPAVAKIMERSLRLLFASADLSTLRHYLQRQWTRILANRVSIADFVFAKEVRLGTYSARAGIIPPAALVATRAMAADPRAEPRYGERVPYVVIYGEPGARLVDMVVPPRALVESAGRLRLHALYYITKQINPALERVLSLVGADVKAWFAEMPRPARMLPQKRSAATLGLENSAGQGGRNAQSRRGGATTIDRFYLSRHCAVCDELTHASRPLCERCTREPQLAAGVLSARLNRLERQYVQLLRVCLACGGGGGTLESSCGGRVACDSLDCGVYFERRKVWWELQTAEALATAGLRELR
jgi:DNA polymerase zeta